MRSFVIRRIIVVQALKLQLELSLSLFCGFQFRTLSCKLRFFLLGFALGGLFATLLLLLLHFPLLDLFLKCFQPSLRFFTFSSQFVLLALCFLSVEAVSKPL